MPWTQVANIKGATGAAGANGSPGATGPEGPSGNTVETVQKTGSYVLVLADGGKLIEFTAEADVTLTVPTVAAAAFVDGTVVEIRQYGVGKVNVTGPGVTIRSRGGAFTTAGQYAEATLTKRTGDEWILSGDLTV